MKKFLILFLLFFLVGCNNMTSNTTPSNQYENIPEKYDQNSVAIEDSSVNTKNIDNYLFREDVVYVDLRYYSWVLKDGHIAGFSFYPFYELIATKEGTKDNEGNPTDNRLFRMKNEIGMLGSVGNFLPNYEESEVILNSLFPKDKYIFAIAQSGLECIYFFNLLIQYNYDVTKLYNVGGFSQGTGFTNVAYVNIENPKYLVKGNSSLSSEITNTTFDFMNDLTPIDYD